MIAESTLSGTSVLLQMGKQDRESTRLKASMWVLGLALLRLQWEAWTRHLTFLVLNFSNEMREQG